MVDHAIRAMTTIVRLRAAQRDVARGEAAVAAQVLAEANDHATRCATQRDTALAAWRQWLEARRPDPALIRSAGRWVTDCDRAVAAADLDTRIAAARCDTATSEARQAQARLDVATEVRRDLGQQAARRRDARDMADAADRFLQGRRA